MNEHITKREIFERLRVIRAGLPDASDSEDMAETHEALIDLETSVLQDCR